MNLKLYELPFPPSIGSSRDGGGVCKYQGPYIGDPMERGGVAHIRVHLLRIIWREGRKVHTYQGPSLEDLMERGKGSSYKLRFIYLGSLEKRRKGSNILGSNY